MLWVPRSTALICGSIIRLNRGPMGLLPVPRKSPSSICYTCLHLLICHICVQRQWRHDSSRAIWQSSFEIVSFQAVLKGVGYPLAWKLCPAAVEFMSGIRPASATLLCFGCDEYHFSTMTESIPLSSSSAINGQLFGSIQRTVNERDVY